MRKIFLDEEKERKKRKKRRGGGVRVHLQPIKLSLAVAIHLRLKESVSFVCCLCVTLLFFFSLRHSNNLFMPAEDAGPRTSSSHSDVVGFLDFQRDLVHPSVTSTASLPQENTPSSLAPLRKNTHPKLPCCGRVMSYSVSIVAAKIFKL